MSQARRPIEYAKSRLSVLGAPVEAACSQSATRVVKAPTRSQVSGCGRDEAYRRVVMISPTRVARMWLSCHLARREARIRLQPRPPSANQGTGSRRSDHPDDCTEIAGANTMT